ncbi:Flp pilus assembly protein CpaB [Pseudalkalibacillus berkeleyi]|uniref:Flp pilus assembly protein CpaB n=1 Tax=Pseudalkalibacillus berkeleyi TaxID=1069813 RepID=A0ABS9H662_9BACL|nr:Flp pilus assembly protein CpaB [Pseudalkalibacillus berkeleyi]MCF6139280.1 Flp pilus assembly protein CpaB [Pseudalkalibacillus berkeleyi]
MLRSKLVLVLAIVMGLITTVLFFNYMKQFDSETVASQTKKEVVIASTEIKRNVPITKEMLETKLLPEEGVHTNAVLKMDEAIGQYSTADIALGESLLTNHLQNVKEETLFVSRKVREGFRAVSVGLNLPQSVTNLIEPGDQVDVIGTKKIGDEQVSEFVVQNVTVLAVGRRLVETTEGEPYVEFTSATLEVMPNESVRLVNASESGTVHIVLRTRVKPDKEAVKDDK